MFAFRRLLAAMTAAPLLVAPGLGRAAEPQAPAESQGATVAGLPAYGALFGAYVGVDPHTGPDRQSATLRMEQQLGRRLGLQRVYHHWNDTIPSAYDVWVRDHGTRLLMSWDTRTRSGWVTWRDVAAGRQDTVIRAKARALRAFRAPVLLIFQHEPELVRDKAGTPDEYIRAFRHIHDVMAASGATNVSMVLNLMAYTLRMGNGDAWYPGSAYVAALGADGYNWYGCTDPSVNGDVWIPFRDIFAAFYAWGRGKGKPLLIPEWGSSEDVAHPGRKARWIDNARATLKGWPAVKGVAYFNNKAVHGCPPRWIDSSSSALQAIRAMAQDPYFRP
jgi:hypothetical protein